MLFIVVYKFIVVYIVTMKDEIFGRYGEYGKDALSPFGLREIKYGRARLAVLAAFIQAIKKTPLEEIRISDLCRAAEISEPSFYNYFPRKDDLFLYFISLWSVDVQLHTQSITPGIQTIREIFLYTSKKNAKSKRLLSEIIAYQARTDVSKRVKAIKAVTPAEKTMLFGRLQKLEKIPDTGIAPVLEENIKAAIQSGELSSKVDPAAYLVMFASLFFGIPVIARQAPPKMAAQLFNIAFDAMLSGFGGKNKTTKKGINSKQ